MLPIYLTYDIPLLRERVMAAAERAFEASSITRALERIERDLRLTPVSRNKRIKHVREMFWMMVESKYFLFDSEDPYILIEEVGLFLCSCANSDESELFDKFLDIL